MTYSSHVNHRIQRVQQLTYARWYGNLRVVPESISEASGGWFLYESAECPPTYLRYLPNERGRWTLRELFVDSSEGQPITATLLNRIPLSRIESVANRSSPAGSTIRYMGASFSPLKGEPSSNLSVLASHFGMTFTQDKSDNWVVQAALGEQIGKKAPRRNPLRLDEDYHLDGPPGSEGLTDEFLTRVARAYAAAVARGESPNKTIQRDVQHKTSRSVERWVSEARKRAIMPAGRKGARG